VTATPETLVGRFYHAVWNRAGAGFGG